MGFEVNRDEIQLAREYMYLLTDIRKQIQYLNYANDAKNCLQWLAKLDQADITERIDRNILLTQLRDQVTKRRIGFPFNQPPPSATLQQIVDDLEDSSHTNSQTERSSTLQSSDTNFQEESQVSNQSKLLHDLVEDYRQQLGKINSDKLSRMKHFFESRVNVLNNMLDNYESENKTLAEELRKHRMYEKNNIELKKTNVILTRELNKYRIYEMSYTEMKRKNDEFVQQIYFLEDNIQKLMYEFDKLKEENKNVITSQHEELLKRDEIIADLEESVKQCEYNGSALYEHKISLLRNKHEEELDKLKSDIKTKDQNLTELKQINEDLIKELLELKNNSATLDEVNLEKQNVRTLQKKLKKLTISIKIIKSLFAAHLQQVEHLKDCKIAALEVELKSQDDATTQNCFLAKVDSLEQQYKQILSEAQEESLQQHRTDLKKIHDLEKALLDHGIIVDKMTSSVVLG